MAQDIEFSKNEDQNRLKRSGLNEHLHKTYECCDEKHMPAEPRQTRSMRPFALILAIAIGNILAAQDVLTLPAWMRKAIGQTRSASTKFYGYNDDHDRWQREVRRPHRFIGSYAFEAVRTQGESGRDTLRYRVEGWQDSTRSITTLTFPDLGASFTYLADLKADIAIRAVRAKDASANDIRGLEAERISHWVDHRNQGMLKELMFEPPILPDSATGRKEKLLGVLCEERKSTFGASACSFWVAPELPSPFHEVGRWMPLSEAPFGLLVELVTIGDRLPMKRVNATYSMEFTVLKQGPQARPMPDLSSYVIEEPPPYVPDPNVRIDLVSVEEIAEDADTPKAKDVERTLRPGPGIWAVSNIPQRSIIDQPIPDLEDEPFVVVVDISVDSKGKVISASFSDALSTIPESIRNNSRELGILREGSELRAKFTEFNAVEGDAAVVSGQLTLYIDGR